jgi:hypothetical protein
MRLYRNRRRQGLRSVRILLRVTEIDEFIRLGLLGSAKRRHSHCNKRSLFDHLVGAGEHGHRPRSRELDQLGRLGSRCRSLLINPRIEGLLPRAYSTPSSLRFFGARRKHHPASTPAMVLHHNNTQHLLLGSKVALRIQPETETTLAFVHGLRGTAWAKPCFCSHAEPRS